MVPALSLWLPILVAAVLVFVASSAIHMFFNWHKHDFSGVPDEDGVMDALRGFDIPPGNYSLPHAADMAAMRSEAFQEKVKRGPAAMITVLHPRNNMNKALGQWFVYCLVVGLFAAYVTGLALVPGPSTWRSSRSRRRRRSWGTRSRTPRTRSGRARDGRRPRAAWPTG